MEKIYELTILIGRATHLQSSHGAPQLFTQMKRYPRCPSGDREKLQYIVQQGVGASVSSIPATSSNSYTSSVLDPSFLDLDGISAQ